MRAVSSAFQRNGTSQRGCGISTLGGADCPILTVGPFTKYLMYPRTQGADINLEGLHEALCVCKWEMHVSRMWGSQERAYNDTNNWNAGLDEVIICSAYSFVRI